VKQSAVRWWFYLENPTGNGRAAPVFPKRKTSRHERFRPQFFATLNAREKTFFKNANGQPARGTGCQFLCCVIFRSHFINAAGAQILKTKGASPLLINLP